MVFSAMAIGVSARHALADESDAGARSDAGAEQAAVPSTAIPEGAADAAPSSAPVNASPPDAGVARPISPVEEGPGAASLGAAPAPDFRPPPSDEVTLNLKLYGDTGYTVRNNTDQMPAEPNVYSPGVWNSFSASHLDLFATADWEKLSFLAELLIEAGDNEFGYDAERLQISYLISNWLRVRAGRSHLALGYYNDSYHHGNLFELTTSRPYSVNFEDGGGLLLAHNVGVGADGTIDAKSAGSFRYDLDVGNGRNSDISAVAVSFSEKNDKLVNLRLRWLPPIDGLIIGVNGMRDVVPGLPAAAQITGRAKAEELVGGAHVVYTEHSVHLDLEGFVIRHDNEGTDATTIRGGFLELGYSIGAFTPYVRAEYLRFPSGGDPVYQYSSDSAQGQISGTQSIYYDAKDFSDFRLGVKWLPIPQLALKGEVERLAHDRVHQEIATLKAAFGF